MRFRFSPGSLKEPGFGLNSSSKEGVKMADILRLEICETNSIVVRFECGFFGEISVHSYLLNFRDGKGFFLDENGKEWILASQEIFLNNFLWVWRNENNGKGAEVYFGKNLGKVFRMCKPDV